MCVLLLPASPSFDALFFLFMNTTTTLMHDFTISQLFNSSSCPFPVLPSFCLIHTVSFIKPGIQIISQSINTYSPAFSGMTPLLEPPLQPSCFTFSENMPYAFFCCSCCSPTQLLTAIKIKSHIFTMCVRPHMIWPLPALTPHVLLLPPVVYYLLSF